MYPTTSNYVRVVHKLRKNWHFIYYNGALFLIDSFIRHYKRYEMVLFRIHTAGEADTLKYGWGRGTRKVLFNALMTTG